MEIKRYTAGEIAVATRKGDINVGTEYIRADHLVAAGCLVRVPDGEACSIRDARNKEHSMYEGRLVEFFISPICHEVKEIIIQDAFTHAKLAVGTYDTIVQPVRLVRLEDVG